MRDNPSTPRVLEHDSLHKKMSTCQTYSCQQKDSTLFRNTASCQEHVPLHVEVNRTIRKHLQHICCFERLLHSQSFFEDVCGKLQNCANCTHLHTKARNYTEFKTHISLDVQSTDIHCVTDLKKAPAFRCTKGLVIGETKHELLMTSSLRFGHLWLDGQWNNRVY